MRFLQSLAVIGIFCSANVAAAQNISVGADAGFTRILNGDGMNGFGLDVFGGYALDFGLVPELQLGMHYHSTSEEVMGVEVSASTMSIPIMAGARYQIDLGAPVRPFAGAHVGVTMARVSTEVGGESNSDSNTDLSFNLGGGADYLLSDTMAIGLGIWYWMILSGSTEEVGGVEIETENGQLLNVGLNFRMAI